MYKSISFLLILFILTGYSYSLEAQSQSYQKELLTAVNDLRKKGCKCGRKYKRPTHKLVWNDLLEKSSKGHAQNMSKNSFFEHGDERGDHVEQRSTAAGYNWSFIGENIAWGQTSVEQVMRDWIKSKTHCYLLMDPDFKEIGIYKVGKFWVMNFGKKAWW